jgi:hypothetical protein
MNRTVVFSLAVVAVALSAGFSGCSAQQHADPAASTAERSPQPETPAGNQASATQSGTYAEDDRAEIEAALAKLPQEDRAVAEKQKLCPVTDEPLGSMGTPIKVTVEGREVFVCCEGCVDELKDNFAKYQGKLPEQS